MKRLKQFILYGTAAFILTMVLFVSPILALDLTKSQGTLMDWTLLDDTAGTPLLESNELDSGEGLDASVITFLHIDVCHADGNAAATAAGVSIQIKSGTTDEDWHEWLRVGVTAGTANVGDCDDTSASAQAVIPLTSTTNFEMAGDIFFLKDEGTLADSCLVQLKTFTNDVSITVIDNLVNAYDADDNAYDIVDHWTIVLPASVQSSKVVFYNTDADATYACRIKYTMGTDME